MTKTAFHMLTQANFPGDDKTLFVKDDMTLFVKNLAATVTEDTLKDFFSPAEIDEIRLPKRSSGGSRG